MQEPFAVDVKVIVIFCAVISAALGVYVAFISVLLGENDPLPLVVHTPVVDPPLTFPASVITGEDAQTV